MRRFVLKLIPAVTAFLVGALLAGYYVDQYGVADGRAEHVVRLDLDSRGER